MADGGADKTDELYPIAVLIDELKVVRSSALSISSNAVLRRY
jgi:hypothetical protein